VPEKAWYPHDIGSRVRTRLAGGEDGFEPPVPARGTALFETAPFDHSGNAVPAIETDGFLEDLQALSEEITENTGGHNEYEDQNFVAIDDRPLSPAEIRAKKEQVNGTVQQSTLRSFIKSNQSIPL
jgi:hypothetical protein